MPARTGWSPGNSCSPWQTAIGPTAPSAAGRRRSCRPPPGATTSVPAAPLLARARHSPRRRCSRPPCSACLAISCRAGAPPRAERCRWDSGRSSPPTRRRGSTPRRRQPEVSRDAGDRLVVEGLNDQFARRHRAAVWLADERRVVPSGGGRLGKLYHDKCGVNGSADKSFSPPRSAGYT